MVSTHTIIIGAGAAGLASAACLQHEGIDCIVLEKHSEVATAWRNHYERLHLHTSKKWSCLPFKPFSNAAPKYPSRRNVVEYLDNYVTEMNIHPVFNAEVLSVKKEKNKWIVESSQGIYQSRYVIMATGMNATPKMPEIEGLDCFTGTVMHSSKYKNGAEFTGKNVLVVGFGNSACELAMCLHEHGAFPSLSVRSAVNVVPRDMFGFNVLELGKLTYKLPAKLADKINAPLIRMLVGNLTKLGLKKSPIGPREQIEKERKIPLLDIGTIALIREGHIKVYGDILWIKDNIIHFENGRQHHFDAIILATGYQNNLDSILAPAYLNGNNLNKPVSRQTAFGKDGLYFCGFYLSPMGMLREIGIEAKKIAEDIAKKNIGVNF
ncbi:MAG: NAD(P)/FAD-dependent oxidoreductase [Ferruginibacter sp.]